ncbi:MAG: hypothetical protein LBN27_02615 [Prevotellaceae bacterium]|nr:hypothetical protein [Prevotellaceae bacterium]
MFAFLVSCLFFISCKKITKQDDNPNSSIQYLTTALGGCNNKLAIRNESAEIDTVAISITDDNNIHIFVGLNYTCKSVPFETQCEIIDGVIVMSIIDVGGTYYRCDCYYTFEFVFKQGEKLNQWYKIVLIDPRQETPEIIEKDHFQNKLQISQKRSNNLIQNQNEK